MSKIRVIDLLNKIANGENLPEKVLIEDKVYYLIEDDEGNKVYSQGKSTSNWENFIDHKMNVSRSLNEEVLILDEELVIEEEPEIDIQKLEDVDERYPGESPDVKYELAVRINELIKAVKQLDNQINNK